MLAFESLHEFPKGDNWELSLVSSYTGVMAHSVEQSVEEAGVEVSPTLLFQ